MGPGSFVAPLLPDAPSVAPAPPAWTVLSAPLSRRLRALVTDLTSATSAVGDAIAETAGESSIWEAHKKATSA